MASIIRGDFSFMKKENGWVRRMFEDAFQAVEATPGGWDFLANQSPPADTGFMFWSHPTLSAIDANMKFDGHSGASHGLTMRTMEAIAKQGWESWVASARAQ